MRCGDLFGIFSLLLVPTLLLRYALTYTLWFNGKMVGLAHGHNFNFNIDLNNVTNNYRSPTRDPFQNTTDRQIQFGSSP